MAYEPGAKVYYGTNGSSSDRLVPAPQVSFNTEMVYANDTIAGYSYVVSLSGYATAIDLTSGGANEYGLTDVSDAIEKIRDILSLNSGNLYVTDKNNVVLMECRGGTVRSVTFEESPNNWVNYAPYKAEIEFSEIIISGCNVSNTLSCSSLSIDSSGTAPNLIDISKYKVKSFNDGWSFNIGEQAYNSYDLFQNQYIEVEYTISANGNNFYNENKKLLPAWEQAKNFVQDRLFSQVKGLIDTILNRTNSDNGCSGDKTLSQLHTLATPGGIDGINKASHKIYNETISCEVGEAEGTYSATYKAILKYSLNPLGIDCIHTFTKSKAVQDDNKIRNISLSVQGSITGLIPGGLINTPNTISLPKTGKLFVAESGTQTKYSSALVTYNQISTGSDIQDTLKDILGINMSELEVTGSCIDSEAYPSAASFSSTHDYTSGIITYSAEYNSIKACQGLQSYRNISISVEDSVPIIAEFVVPGRQTGPIIQRIGVNSPKRVSVTIEGVQSQKCCPNVANDIENICGTGVVLPTDIPDVDLGGNMKLTQDQSTVNLIDGSYVINRSYIVIG
jgi:hypothetical protein